MVSINFGHFYDLDLKIKNKEMLIGSEYKQKSNIGLAFELLFSIQL